MACTCIINQFTVIHHPKKVLGHLWLPLLSLLLWWFSSEALSITLAKATNISNTDLLTGYDM